MRELGECPSYTFDKEDSFIAEPEFIEISKTLGCTSEKGLGPAQFFDLIEDIPREVIMELHSKVKLGVKRLQEEREPIKATGGTKRAAKGVPNEFICPITLGIMQRPMIAADGNTYEEFAIKKWL